jgi:hypothetical protein
MPAIATGTKPGEVVVGWYGSNNASGPDDTRASWRFYVARSSDYGAGWEQAEVTKNPFHYGDICTVGILCVTGNRNLLDFASVGVDPKSGCATTVFPGDPYNTLDRQDAGQLDPSAAYIALQNDGRCGNNQSPAGEQGVKGVRSGCSDKTPPASKVDTRRSHFTRTAIALRGTSSDKGCGPKGRGQVARVTVAVARRVGKKCAWLKPKGAFAKLGSCRRKTYVTANGGVKWSFTRKLKLKRGVYSVVPRAIDAVGNVERPRKAAKARRRNRNQYLFTVR